MDIIVSGRHIHISDEVREQIADRLSQVDRLRDRVIRTEVEFTAANQTKGDPDNAVLCELTLRSKGPVVRAEGHAEDKMVAFDAALEKLKIQLRKASDRRKNHRGLRAAAFVPEVPAPAPQPEQVPTTRIDDLEITGDGPLVVREKEFKATPLTLAQALDEMELVGHDFFLYVDAHTSRPSVVYRRNKGYDYGVIHLAS